MNVLEAFDDPRLFASVIPRGDWKPWRAFLAALFALPLHVEHGVQFSACTNRGEWPKRPFNEAYLICGRRAGKSFVLALVATYLATFRSYAEHLGPGERATVMLIAADRRQARILFRYIRGLLTSVPVLAKKIERETREIIELNNRVSIEVVTASYRTTRGYSLAAVLADEAAFWSTDDSANPDTEILAALRPGMGTIPGSILLVASSPYARKGALWEAFKRHYGRDDAPALVWKATTRTMNPGFSQAIVDEALESDPSAAGAEYMAEFRSDIEAFLNRDVLDRCIPPGELERPYVPGVAYTAFVDPSGGSQDSMTLAIGHKEGTVATLDMIREVKPPFNPETVVGDFVADLQRYHITEVTGDRYAGEWVRDPFRRRGITYRLSEHAKSDIYKAFLPLVNAQQVELLDHPRMVAQFIGLERRTGRSGRDSVDHGSNSHDDVANVVAGVLAAAAVKAWARPVAATGVYTTVAYGPGGSGRANLPPPDWFKRGDKYAPGDIRWNLEKKL